MTSTSRMKLPVIELAGTPRAMGETFGETCRAEINDLYTLRLDAAITAASEWGNRTYTPDQVLDLAEKCLPISQKFDPQGHEESLGIAQGANLTPAQVFVLHGLTDLRDLLAFGSAVDEGCSAFLVARDRGEAGQVFVGQNWDLQTDNMPYVRLVHRRPSDAPETWSVTPTGCLSLIGMNSEGIAVGNTNLVTNDARLGVHYLSVIHRALRCSTVEEAVAVIRDAPRAGAHFYYVAGPTSAVAIECSATCSVVTPVDQGTYAHCNHALNAEIAQFEYHLPADCSPDRQNRFTDMLKTHDAPIGVNDLRQMLSDRHNDQTPICRYENPPGYSTNAAVIMSPGTGEIHACGSQPDAGEWVTKRFSPTS